MARVNTKRLVVFVGNSIMNYANTEIKNAFDAAYGSSNYEYVNIAVGGQTLSDMIFNFTRKDAFHLSRYREVILVVNETRNELKLNTPTPAQCKQKAEDYCALVKSVSPNVTIFYTKCSAATLGTFQGAIMNDVPQTNNLLDTNGSMDHLIDVYNYSDFSDCLDTTLFSDGVHHTALGRSEFAEKLKTDVTSIFT